MDGTKNNTGTIEHCAWLKIQMGKKKISTRFLATGLGKEKMILGLPWLKQYNPKIDWNTETIDIDSIQVKTTFDRMLLRSIELARMEVITPQPRPTMEEVFEDTDHLPANKPLPDKGPILQNLLMTEEELKINLMKTYLDYENEVWIKAKTLISQELAYKTIDDKAKELSEFYAEYRMVFEKEASEWMPEHKPWDHAIDLKPNFIPKDCKVYPLSPKEQKEQDKFLEENLRKGYIRPLKLLMASLFFFVSKKDLKKLRPCQDYRHLNEGTIKNTYPLLRVDELLDKLKGAKHFTKLDLRWGYNNVWIKIDDKWKAAFKMNKGLFEPLVMFFGLCNSPATFQNMMNNIFLMETNEGWILIYIDDILIFSKEKEDLQKLILWVLKKLQENNLFINLDKCTFEAKEVDYLGMIISENQIKMDPAKLEGIRDWLTPTTVKQVWSFLGIGNFYRKFIRHYTDITQLWNDLTKKDLIWNWTDTCQEAFEKLKEEFQKAPVLLMPDSMKLFVIESNASKFATGAVIWQKDMNRDYHPCGYISHSFDATQWNYEIYNWKLMDIVRALETWQHYLQGSPFPTGILSDHKNLTYFRTAQKLNRWQAQWSLFLSEFNLKLIHTPRSRMIQFDALSWWPDHITDEIDNDNIIVLSNNIFIKMIDLELQDEIKNETAKDDFFVKALQAIKENSPPPTRSSLEEWKIEEVILFFKDRCYIPPHEELWREVVKWYYDSLSGGHPGHFKTLELIRHYYWWPGMTVFVKNYVAGCAICQQMKINTHPSSPGLILMKGQKDVKLFSQVTCDFITDLPESDGFDSLMVVVDRGSTKGVISIPCNNTINAMLIA